RGKENHARTGFEGVHSLVEGKSKQGQRGTFRYRKCGACRRLLLSEGHRCSLWVRALSRRESCSAGFGGRKYRLHYECCYRFYAASSRRKRQSFCCYCELPLVGLIRNPHRGRGWLAPVLLFTMVWVVGSKADAGQHYPQTQRCSRRRLGRP